MLYGNKLDHLSWCKLLVYWKLIFLFVL